MPTPSMYQAESDELARRKALADMLQQQSMQPIETQSVGGIPTPISPLQGLSKLYQGYQGGKEQKEVTQGQQDLSKRYQEGLAEALRKSQETGSSDALLMSGHPLAQQIGMSRMTADQAAKAATDKMNAEYGMKKQFALDPEVIAAQSQIRRAGKTDVTVNNPQEKEESKTVGKGFGEQYNKLQESALASQSKINRVERLDQLLQGVDTGKLTPAGAEIAGYAQSLGIKVDPKLGNIQAAEALSNELALELRNPAGGAGMPGALSDKDREFLKAMTPGIEKTPEGRKLISESYRKLAQRDVEVAQLARDYRNKKGQMDEGFYNELREYSKMKPIFQNAETQETTQNPAIDALLKKYGTAR